MLTLTLPASGQPADTDEPLTSKLRKAFRQVDGLEEVRLEVRGGVAVLRGTVPSLEAKYQAEELATKLEGVLAVDNGLTVENRVSERITPALSSLYDKLSSILSFLPLLLVAGVLFTLFIGMGSVFTRWDWFFSRFSDNVFVQDLLKQVTWFIFAIVGSLVALEVLEATALVGALLGTAGVFGIAIGFAFRDMAENSLASVLLSLRQPFSPNDHVVIDGNEGKVVRLTSRATILLTLDGNHLRLPNSSVFKAVILNYTRNPERRFTFQVGIGVDEELAPAQALAVKTLLESPGIIEEPRPQCLVQNLGDSNVVLELLAWVDQEKSEYLKVRSEAVRRVKEAFDEAGIEMPEPIYRVRNQALTPPQEKKKPTKVAETGVGPDVEPERHLERLIQDERVSARPDLLDEQGTIE